MRGRTVRLLAIAACAVAGSLAITIAGSSAQSGGAQAASFRLAEFNFGGSTRLAKSGQTTLRLWNAGRFPHNFTIVAGPTKVVSKTLNPNETQNLAADLKPGAYMVVCTVRQGGHMRDGMHLTFTVGNQDPATGDWSG